MQERRQRALILYSDEVGDSDYCWCLLSAHPQVQQQQQQQPGYCFSQLIAFAGIVCLMGVDDRTEGNSVRWRFGCDETVDCGSDCCYGHVDQWSVLNDIWIITEQGFQMDGVVIICELIYICSLILRNVV